MGRIIIINASAKKTGYWANERCENSFLLNTHRAAAAEFVAARKQNDATYVNLAGGRIVLRGPVVLERWQRNRDFFTLHFDGVEQPAKLKLSLKATNGVLTGLKKGQHLVICVGDSVTHVNMENRPHPSVAEVEEALRAANVAPVSSSSLCPGSCRRS